MEFFGMIIGIFSGVIGALAGLLTYQARQNGRWMRQAHQETQALLARMDERTAKMDEHLVKMDERTAKMDERTAKMDERTAKMDEHLVKMDEHLVKMDEHWREAFREMARSQERIAELIKAEGERTRTAILSR